LLCRSQGAEVVHLGHNRSVGEVVKAAIERTCTASAISSYQGGHMEYFRYLVTGCGGGPEVTSRLRGGGGGVIVPVEIENSKLRCATDLLALDGQRLGLDRMDQPP